MLEFDSPYHSDGWASPETQGFSGFVYIRRASAKYPREPWIIGYSAKNDDSRVGSWSDFVPGRVSDAPGPCRSRLCPEYASPYDRLMKPQV